MSDGGAPEERPGGLKDDRPGADEKDVLDEIRSKSRLTWDSVTDGADAPPPAGEEPDSGGMFSFDLDGALARVAGDEDAPAPPVAPDRLTRDTPAEAAPPPAPRPDPIGQPVAAAPAAPAPAPSPPPAPSPAPAPSSELAQRTSARPDSVQPGTGPAAPGDVFGDSGLPQRGGPPTIDEPTPPDYPRRVPGANLDASMQATASAPEISRPAPIAASPQPAARTSVFDDTGSGRSGIPGASPGGASAPILPASNPAAPPPVVDPVDSAPSTPDITALRSAQLRASRQQRQGRLFGRSLLAFVVIGGLLAGALFFGRSLLFPTEWDARLTPVVNDVQDARGSEFESTVPLVLMSESEFGRRLASMTIGDTWIELVPQWRALGLAMGDVTPDTVAGAFAASTSAVYDADDDTIYYLESADPDAAIPDVRVALEAAFDDQLGSSAEQAEATDGPDGFVGVSSPLSIASRAVDRVVVAGGSASERQPANQALPLPIAYELAAIDVLGEPILTAADVDPATLTLASSYPESIGEVLGDSPANTASGILRPGEQSLASAAALGTDDWSLVWATRLPDSTVNRLIGQVRADSYHPIQRGETVCFVGVFESPSQTAGSSVFAAMLSWAANSPATSQAVATALTPTRTQIEACDPGASGGIEPNEGAVDSLIDRQQLRLTS